MHPAYSVILFTTASGAGYGLLFLLGLGHAFGFVGEERWFLFTALAVAMAFITTGLLSSTLHLGHPERAIGAFSQWRSSWLSREGVLAVATYIPAGLLGLIWLFGWESGLTSILGILAAIGAALTVYCTGMIYGSLRTIRQWHEALTSPVYLALAFATGALLLTLLSSLFGYGGWFASLLALIGFIVAGILKYVYWGRIDADQGQYTAEMATGLGQFGTVRPLDPPHTRPNFVMREMGYSVARKHAKKLRLLCLILLFAVPIILMLLSLMTGWQLFFSIIAVLSAGIGVAVERWLFFAEATHVSMLFYGAQRA